MSGSSRTHEILDTLSAGIAQLTSSDRWHTWLTVQSRFHTYSANRELQSLTDRGSPHVGSRPKGVP